MAAGGSGFGSGIKFSFEGISTQRTSPLSPSDTRAKTNNGLECRICNDLFALQGEKVPRLLSCGHSVCHQCMTNLQTEAVVTCPFDRTNTNIGDAGIWGLKKNFALLELLEIVEQIKEPTSLAGDLSTDSTPLVKCEEDDLHTADVFCTVCLSNLCSECAKETHKSRTLQTHKIVAQSEKPRMNPPCPLHQNHLLEFACLEEGCADNPLMCYLCKDYGQHKGHKHVLIEAEAETIRKSIQHAMQHIKSFSEEVIDFARKLSGISEKIEGGVVLRDGGNGVMVPTPILGNAESARVRVREYFNDLRDTIRQQENEALSVVNSYVRESLCSLRQRQEDMAVLRSQIHHVCAKCEQALQRSHAEVIIARGGIVNLLETVQQQQQYFAELSELCNTTEGPEIPFAFTKDNRVHIGPKMEMRVLALGLDNAGKTSILFKLKQNEFVAAITTIGFNVETIEHKSVKFTIWDVGGVQKLRPLWRHYYLNTQAVIFVIDSTNVERLTEAREELEKLLAEKRLQDALILICANKQDLPSALSLEELKERTGIHRLCSGRTWTMVSCSAHTGSGLQETLDWMARQLLSEFHDN